MNPIEWQPSPPPRTWKISPTLSVEPASTGWQTALHRNPRIDIQPTDVATSEPGVVAIKLGATLVRVRSFGFPNGATGWLAARGDQRCAPRSGRTATDLSSRGRTRVRPSDDVVRLQDRLYFLLQPPLESVLMDRSLSLPHDPYEFQLQGIAFLFPRHSAVLADEMGLGKTMQAVTTLRLLLHHGHVRHALLICPKPLLTNWQREFQMWAPELPVTVISGNQKRRQWLWKLHTPGIVAVNYEVVVRDQPLFDDPDIYYDLVLLDEAQRIKNRDRNTNRAVCGIRRQRSWALTGTPVENGPEDLVGIFEFLAPGTLRPEMKPSRIGRAVSDYILRRTKDEVLNDLPPKLDRDAVVELTRPQREAYELAEKEGLVRLSSLGDSLSIQHVFELILRLKQICNFDPATKASAKLELLEADLQECVASGRKAIIFSQWVDTLTQLQTELTRFGTLAYHGRVPPRHREAVLEKFRNCSKSSVLLMTYGAGGVGLNLQFASYVFLFDRWWNPAVEDQAINRAHRIGASGPVTVTRFITAGTIEERIDQILRKKREVFDTIFSGTVPVSHMALTEDEVFSLFKLEKTKASAA